MKIIYTNNIKVNNKNKKQLLALTNNKQNSIMLARVNKGDKK